VVLSQASLRSRLVDFEASGVVPLHDYELDEQASGELKMNVSRADLVELFSAYAGVRLPTIQGLLSGTFAVTGTLRDPHGSGAVNVNSLNAYGELLNQVKATLALDGPKLSISKGQIEASDKLIAFDGTYSRSGTSWTEGNASFRVSGAGFPIARLGPARRYAPDWDGLLDVDARARIALHGTNVELQEVNGAIDAGQLTFRHALLGNLTLRAATHASELKATLGGTILGKSVAGTVESQLGGDQEFTSNLHFVGIPLAPILATAAPKLERLRVEGLVSGEFTAHGSWSNLQSASSMLQIHQLALSIPATSAIASPSTSTVSTPVTHVPLQFRNKGDFVLASERGRIAVKNFLLVGPETEASVSGSFGLSRASALDLSINGQANLKLVELFRSDIRSEGSGSVAAQIKGTLAAPSFRGRAEIKDASFSSDALSNELTAVSGSVRFDGSRATIERLTAQSGGGVVQVTGFVTVAFAAPTVYNLQASAQNVRFRYANAVSVTGNSSLRLTGTAQDGRLSGDVTITRIVLSSNVDFGSLIANAGAPKPVAQNDRDLFTGLQLDVHIQSSDDLQVSSAISQNLQADIDLRLRGAPDHPQLLGTISANQGDINLFGARYTINRGVVNFVNTVRIEPSLDLDLQTESRGVAVSIIVSGTPSKLNLNYRSDPPLQPKDIIALLTVGQAPSYTTSGVGNTQVTNDTSALQAGANTILGQAASPVSNRLSKLFGITNIKIDPLVQGITNTPQARLTLEQQISRNVTVTYVTNLAQTSEQIFRFEWTLNRQYSIVAVRDDNGEFGINIQYRRRF
jgi:translocation and assembly module TamB